MLPYQAKKQFFKIAKFIHKSYERDVSKRQMYFFSGSAHSNGPNGRFHIHWPCIESLVLPSSNVN